MLNYSVTILLAALLLVTQPDCIADDDTTLPDPLTLDYVLNIDVMSHPVLQLTDANIQKHQARQIEIDGRYQVNAEINARIQYIEPSQIAIDQSNNDHKLSLFVRKKLYDFGRTRAADRAINARVESEHKLQDYVLDNHRIAIMTAYFNVLLADLQFLRDNEAMASAFIDLDRARARKELGQVSELEVLELNNEYQKKRQQYFISQNMQRTARSRLAVTLGMPGAAISELTIPDIHISPDDIPDADVLQQYADNNNTKLLALKSKLDAARLFVEESRLNSMPSLNSELELSEYARTESGNDQWRANITLSIPLSTNSEDRAKLAKRRANLVATRSELQLARAYIMQDILETRMQLDNLRIESEQKHIQELYRDYYLDKNRTLYQMEYQAELGDAMIELTSAQLESARTRYETAIAWARLQTLLGLEIDLTSDHLLRPSEAGHE